jgi:hypothetical protein
MKRVLTLLLFVALAIAFKPSPGLADEEGKLTFSGDFRGRWEGFRFSEDELNTHAPDRRRLRYRLRVGAKAKISPHTIAEIQIGTGDQDNRSGNQTMGSPIDFGPNELDVRKAFLTVMPFADGKLPGGKGEWAFQFGKVANPFLWKNGRDIMLWDNDIDPAGLSTTFKTGENGIATFANAAYFVISELSGQKDPYLASLQAGVEGGKKDGMRAGIRGTFYLFDNLDSLFVQRGVDGTGGVTAGGGNVPDGLTGSTQGGEMQVIETQVFLDVKRWPVLVYGGYSTNLGAEASTLVAGVGQESVAFNVGLEGGDKKKYVHVGVAFYHIEANAFPSQFTDSDLLDGVTNRQGPMVYASRQLFKNTDLNLQVTASDAIETAPGFAESIANSERIRWALDVVGKF